MPIRTRPAVARELARAAARVSVATVPADPIERLEGRTLFNTYALANGVLTVTGTSKSEVIALSVEGTTIRAANSTTGTSEIFIADNVTGILVNAVGGNDSVTIAAGITKPATINGGSGNDTLTGGNGNDSLFGGDGDDTLAGRSGADALAGGNGTDTATYAAYTGAVTVTLNDVADDGLPGELDNVRTDVENVIGGIGNDILVGSGAANVLSGNAGNDAISGGAGDDSLVGGLGNDTLSGGKGNDTMVGGAGADILAGGEGNGDVADYRDRTDAQLAVFVSLDALANDGETNEKDNVGSDTENLYGGAGDDVLTGNGSRNYLDGGDGDDTLSGGRGDDLLVGGPGDDSLAGSDGKDTLDGGTGADLFNGGAQIDTATYAARLNNLSLTIDGTANDGESGENDNLLGDIENLIAGSGNDTLRGNAKDNYLEGGNGKDTIFGGSGNDTLVGGRQADQLFGEGGNDTLAGLDTFKDTLSGGSGTDTVSNSDAIDVIDTVP
jgi:Ca2+-binding RTX toxin-like protein